MYDRTATQHAAVFRLSESPMQPDSHCLQLRLTQAACLPCKLVAGLVPVGLHCQLDLIPIVASMCKVVCCNVTVREELPITIAAMH